MTSSITWIRRTFGVLTMLIALGTSGAIPAAFGSHTQESIFEDEAAFQHGTRPQWNATLDTIGPTLGADSVRLLVDWNRFAPSPNARRRPAFNPTDPAAYDQTAFTLLDQQVADIHAHGLSVLFTLAGASPTWATTCPHVSGHRATVCKPNPAWFGQFVKAVGRRYSGHYVANGGVVEAVNRFSIWNEPNQPGWLYPEFATVNGRVEPVAAAWYRKLAYATIAALRATGHGTNQIMLGETAPLGHSGGGALATRAMSPGVFWRAMLCIDTQGRSLRGKDAAALGCGRHFTPFRVNAAAHHPYTRGGSQKPTTRPAADEITITYLSRLEHILALGSHAHRLPANLPIFYTEYGYQTNPPDSLFGVSLSNQALYLNQSDYIAYNQPRVRSVAQYELRDVPDLASFQTGLEFANGDLKPAFIAYRLPIYVVKTRAHGRVKVFGLARSAPAGSRPLVEIQHASSLSGPFVAVKTVTANSTGYFVTSAPGAGGYWRLSYLPLGGLVPDLSRVATAATR